MKQKPQKMWERLHKPMNWFGIFDLAVGIMGGFPWIALIVFLSRIFSHH